MNVSKKLFGEDVDKIVNNDLINFYMTPGNLYRMFIFAKNNNCDLSNIDLKEFLNIIIKDKLYKKNLSFRFLIFDLIEFYFIKINSSFSSGFNNKYSYFINKLSNIKKYNLDEEAFFIEFEDKVLNG